MSYELKTLRGLEVFLTEKKDIIANINDVGKINKTGHFIGTGIKYIVYMINYEVKNR